MTDDKNIMVRRAGQLSAAFQLYQQAADMPAEEEERQGGSGIAEAVAEASLKLAFLCNDLLQVSSSIPI